MRPTVMLVALACLASDAGVARATLGPGDTNGISITVGSLNRQYDVHVPPGYDGSVAVPLVLDFHGYSSTAAQQAGTSGLKPLADANGFIIAFPTGYGPPGQTSWNAGICCDPAKADGVDDIAFARAVVADIAAAANVDAFRVYVTGLSNGAFMSHRLACEAADLFAAVAPVAAPLGIDPVANCQPIRPIPLLQFSGLSDMVVPYGGGPTLVFPAVIVMSALDSFTDWAGLNGCSDPASFLDLGNGASLRTHTTCLDGVQVGLYSINGSSAFFGHVLYLNTDGIDVAQCIWDFLSQFTLPGGLTTTSTSTSTSTTTTTIALAVAIDGAKLTLKDDPAESRRKATIASKDVDISLGGGNGSGDDPRTVGATVRIASAAGDGFDDTYDLPASGWALIGREGENKGYKYKDALLANGPVKSASLRPAKLLKVAARGSGLQHTLAGNPDPVDVVVTFGGLTYCQHYGGVVTFKTPRQYSAKSAPAGTCPALP